MTRVKICCMASPEEARIAASAGADLVGLVGPMPSGAGIITEDMCRAIATTAPDAVSPVLLTSAETPEDIARQIRFTGVSMVQLVRHVAPGHHRALADALPTVKRLQVIHVEDAGALDLLDTYKGLADFYLLDSGRPSAQQLGGTGRTHDWGISAEFVARADAPVFLAGGLNAGNVEQAIRVVQPYGVDICSGVRTASDRLDPARLDAFMAAVNRATSQTQH